jgi:hypothetical protein
MRLVFGVAAGLFALSIAACSDNPMQPKFAAPATDPVARSISLSAPALAKCEAAIDPDWLCQSQSVRDNLCPLLQRGGPTDIVFAFRFFTLTYRVTFAPTADGGAVITVAFVPVRGAPIPLGQPVTIPAVRVTNFCAA